MNKEDISKYKLVLEKELGIITDELKTVGKINPNNPKDWEPAPADMDIHRSESDEVADKMESLEENTAILNQLEAKYNEIKSALKKIEDGTYGVCEIGGEQIEKERLEANPSATTCLVHLKK